MKKYYCVHCGRLLGAPVGHRCKGTFRSRNLQFKAFDMVEEKKEMIDHPSHYNNGSMEVIEMMLKLFGEEKVMAFCELNAYKYRMRAGYKGNAEEDIHKALWYEKKYKEIRQALDEIQQAGLASNGDVVYADSTGFRLKKEGLTQRQIDNILKK